jgi:methionyl-tRNA formyltransferase
MKLVVLASDSPFASYVIQEVEREWPIQRVVRPILTRSPTAPSNWRKFKEAPVSRVLSGLRLGYCVLQRKRLTQQISRILFGSHEWPKPPATEFPSWVINGPEVANLLRELAPDVMLVCGGPILRPPVFSVPRLGTINIHFGISPNYRGEHTLFWPLRLGDHEHVGVTLHYIIAGIDTGPVLAQGFPAIEASDTEATLWAKCARMAAELMVEYLHAIHHGPIAGQSQGPEGRQIRFLDRRAWMDARYLLERRLLNRRPAVRGERSIKHFPTVSAISTAPVNGKRPDNTGAPGGQDA